MSFRSLVFEFNIGRSTVSEIIYETCHVIWNRLQAFEMPEPTKEMWIEIANTFHTKTNFPNCLGAIDGKHQMQEPQKCWISIF